MKHRTNAFLRGDVNKQPGTRLVLTTLTVLVATIWFCYSQKAYGATPAEIQQWLQAHNHYRNLHGVPSVTWSATVALSAQAWANTCPSNHSSSGYGENIVFATYIMTIPNVVKLWYDEEPLYDYNNPGFSPATGHFTQVVWKSTKEIGCGYRGGCGGSWPNVWVCQYDPAGNYTGSFADNVFPKSSPPPPPGKVNIVPIITSILLGE